MLGSSRNIRKNPENSVAAPVPTVPANISCSTTLVWSWVVDWQVKRFDEFARSGSGKQLFLCSDHDGAFDPIAGCLVLA